MCLLCIEIAKDAMTCKEVFKARQEFKIEQDHVGDVVKLIREKYTSQEINEALLEEYLEQFD
jgi:hypothetical protein